MLIDALPIPLFYCNSGGWVVELNSDAGEVLAGSMDEERLVEEIRLLCVALQEIHKADETPADVQNSLQRMVLTRQTRYRLRAVGVRNRPNSEFGSFLVMIESLRARPIPDEVLQDRFHLTPAEVRVFRELVQESSLREIGRRLFISRHTVRHHTEHIYLKLQVHSRDDLRQWLGETWTHQGPDERLSSRGVSF